MGLYKAFTHHLLAVVRCLVARPLLLVMVVSECVIPSGDPSRVVYLCFHITHEGV